MKITVTHQHIDEGQRGSTTRDPIAFAMADAGCLRPHVGVTHISWQDAEHKRYSVEVTEKIYEFIRDFDQGEPVEPFEFQIMDGKVWHENLL